jgi:hypothetical protein
VNDAAHAAACHLRFAGDNGKTRVGDDDGVSQTGGDLVEKCRESTSRARSTSEPDDGRDVRM